MVAAYSNHGEEKEKEKENEGRKKKRKINFKFNRGKIIFSQINCGQQLYLTSKLIVRGELRTFIKLWAD